MSQADYNVPVAPTGTDFPFDADAALVTATLRHLRHLEHPERYLVRDAPAVPRHKVGWVREVLRALRAAGAYVVYPRAADAPPPAPARAAAPERDASRATGA